MCKWMEGWVGQGWMMDGCAGACQMDRGRRDADRGL